MIALRDSIGSDFVERTESFFSAERTSGEGEKFRATSPTTANGGGSGAGAGRGATSGGGSRHRRRQIAGVSRSRGPVRARAKEKGNHLNPHHQSSGATSLQRHSDSTKSSARDFRCGV